MVFDYLSFKRNRWNMPLSSSWTHSRVKTCDHLFQAIKRMNSEYEYHKKEWKGKHGLTEYDSLAVEFMPLDLASFKSTLDFVTAFKNSGRQLHILVCNAGIGMVPYGKSGECCSHVTDFNARNICLTAKLLQQGYRYHKLRKNIF